MSNTKISALTSATTPLAGTETLPIVQSSTTKQVSVANLTAGRAVSANSFSSTGNSTFNTTAGIGWTVGARSDNAISAIYSTSVTPNSVNYAFQAAASVTYVNNPTSVSLAINDNAIVTVTATTATVPAANLVFGTAAKGINFTANTPAAGMTSQLLNWYEEGTFTPTVYGTSTAGTATYSIQLGKYTRIGRLVTLEIYLNWSGGTGTGNLAFGGLPYAVGSNSYGAVSVVPENIALTAGNILVARLLSGASYIEPLQTPTGGGGLNTVPYDAAGNIMMTATYSV